MENKINNISGDSLTPHSGLSFTTFDKDQDVWDKNCAEEYKGAYWHGACHQSNLNGLYLRGETDQHATGMVWEAFKGYDYALKVSEMKFKPVYDY